VTSGLKPYPAYRASNLPWVRDVPEHWDVERAKWLFQKMDRPVEETDEVVTCFRDGMVTLRKNRRARGFTESLKEIGYQGIRRGDLVIHGMDAFAGAVGVSDSDGKGTPVYSVCEPAPNANAHYYAYVVREMARSEWILALAKGIRERSTDFRFDGFASQAVPLPPPKEQAAIVRFLDHADRRMRRYIATKRKLIALIGEQRQAIIDSAVTGGVNRAETSQELGSAPSARVNGGWNIARLWAIADIRTEKNRPDLELLSVFLGRGVIPYGEGGGQVHKPSLELSGYQVVYPGDLVLNNQQAWRGSVGVSTHLGIVSPAYVVLRLSPVLDQRFAGYLFASRSVVAQFVTASKGVGDIQRDIHIPWLKNARIPIPPREVQVAIADHLDRQLAELESRALHSEREVDLLMEFRTRLISDVATGKLDVREAAANLPEEIEAAEPLEAANDLTEGDKVEDEADLDAVGEEVAP
jgi:type I restriction enzyme S subunit